VRVLLDNRDIGVDRPDFPGAIEAGVAACQALGRVVVEVKADGKALNDNDLRALASAGASVSVVELISAEPRTLVAGTLAQAVQALDRVREQQQLAAGKVHSGKPEEAVEGLQTILGTWQAVQQAVDQGGTLLGVKLGEIGFLENPGGLSAAAKLLFKDLTALRTGLEGNDWSAVGDVLGFDLEAHAVRWQDGLRHLTRELVKTGSGGLGVVNGGGEGGPA
jgi:hypothetical protein